MGAYIFDSFVPYIMGIQTVRINLLVTEATSVPFTFEVASFWIALQHRYG
jgi:hypothetical protein